MVKVTRAYWDENGPEITARVAAFIEARRQHAFTVDVPAPTEDSLVVEIADAGGVEAIEILEHDAVGNVLPPEAAGLDMARAASLRFIDDQAERLRQMFITPGAGQTLEYEATAREARAWQPGESLEAYPFLEAEARALEEATGMVPVIEDLIADVIAQADAWVRAGSQIKRLRRMRKMRIEAAAEYATIAAIIAEPWEVLP